MSRLKGTPKWLQSAILILVAVFFTGIIFIIDINLPKTIVFGAVYCVVILYSWLLPGKYTSAIVGLVCTILMIVGLAISPISIEEDIDHM